MSRLIIGTNSWLTVAEADAYMDVRFGSWEFWTDDTNKEAALITAYKKIVQSGFFDSLPDTANENLKDAQCEMALYLIMEGGDLLRRAGLQAQGVVQAGIPKETYDPEARGKLSFPPEVMALLKEYTNQDAGAFFFDLSRDDTEDVNL
jgi:hypothetical protein